MQPARTPTSAGSWLTLSGALSALGLSGGATDADRAARRAVALDAAGLALAALTPMVLIAINYTPGLHPGATALMRGDLVPPDPRTCTVGSCFDGANKFGFPMCTEGTGGYVRGVLVPKGVVSCYRSIYYNIEPNTLLAILPIAFLVVASSRVAERAFEAWWGGRLRWLVLLAVIGAAFPFMYSSFVVFIYVNEHRYAFMSSQLFFTLSEYFSTLVLASLLDRARPVHRPTVILAGGVALMHFLQLGMDELLGPLGTNAKRNAGLLLGDASVLIGTSVALAEHDKSSCVDPKAWVQRALVAGALIVLFQLAFAGWMSFSVFAGFSG